MGPQRHGSRPLLLPDGSSMNITLNQIFGSIGTALYTLIVYRLFATTDSASASTASASAATSLTMGSIAAMILSAVLTLLALVAFAAIRTSIAKDYAPQESAQANAQYASQCDAWRFRSSAGPFPQWCLRPFPLHQWTKRSRVPASSPTFRLLRSRPQEGSALRCPMSRMDPLQA